MSLFVSKSSPAPRLVCSLVQEDSHERSGTNLTIPAYLDAMPIQPNWLFQTFSGSVSLTLPQSLLPCFAATSSISNHSDCSARSACANDPTPISCLASISLRQWSIWLHTPQKRSTIAWCCARCSCLVTIYLPLPQTCVAREEISTYFSSSWTTAIQLTTCYYHRCRKQRMLVTNDNFWSDWGADGTCYHQISWQGGLQTALFQRTSATKQSYPTYSDYRRKVSEVSASYNC